MYAERNASTNTLRAFMRSLEGDAEFQIDRGVSAWSIERTNPDYPHRREVCAVFGTCRSDALRRASAPCRLGEEWHGDVTTALRFECGWDEPIRHPRARVPA